MRLAIDLRESLHIALNAIRANKARGALTTLGIIIGIVAVVLTMTVANGLQNTFRQSFSAVGTDVLHVSRMPWVVMNDFFVFRNRRHYSCRLLGAHAPVLSRGAIERAIARTRNHRTDSEAVRSRRECESERLADTD